MSTDSSRDSASSSAGLNIKPAVDMKVDEDIDEDDEDVSQKSSGISYRMFGVAFLVIAIIVAIVLAAVPTSLDGDIPNKTNGWIFHILIGVFLIFLFSCLFCTYYLGGSKDVWEPPEFTGIRINFSNITAILGLLVEFIQICSFSFNPNLEFTGSDSLHKMQYLALPFSPGQTFRIMYWIVFVVAFSPYIFVVSVRMIIYTINHRKGEQEAGAFVHKYQQKIYSILWFLVNTIYIPVISTMMAGIDCTFDDNSGRKYVDSDSSLACLSGAHVPYIICSLIALVIYYPAASFAQAQTQNISDIKFKPKIVFIFVQGKVVMAAMNVFFTNYLAFYLSIILVVHLMFLVVNIWKEPCLVPWINQLRTILFTISLWSTVCSFIALPLSSDPRTTSMSESTPLALLVVGWCIIALLLPISFLLWPRVRSLVIKDKVPNSV